MEEIMRIAKQYNLKVIEDAAHALPSFYRNKKVGSLSDAVCFSFYATKTLSTGEGGMVFTNDEELDKSLRELREFGRVIKQKSRFYNVGTLKDYDVRYVSKSIGYNCRMTDVAAAIGRVQLSKLDSLNAIRREVVASIVASSVASIVANNVANNVADNVASGIYFVNMITKDNRFTKKITLLKLMVIKLKKKFMQKEMKIKYF